VRTDQPNGQGNKVRRAELHQLLLGGLGGHLPRGEQGREGEVACLAGREEGPGFLFREGEGHDVVHREKERGCVNVGGK